MMGNQRLIVQLSLSCVLENFFKNIIALEFFKKEKYTSNFKNSVFI